MRKYSPRRSPTTSGLAHFGGLRSDGNRVRLFHDGDRAFHAMWKAIRAAKERVWLEVYTLAPDPTGLRTIAMLTRQARAGLAVRLLVDDVGSLKLSDEHVAPLIEAGGEYARFNPLMAIDRLAPPQIRDHRKILIADDHAFAGGMNQSSKYAGPRLGDGLFRDTQMQIQGPAVAHLAQLFEQSWRNASNQAEQDGTAEYHPKPVDGEHALEILDSDQLRNRRRIQAAIRHCVDRADSTCFFTTPYFVPPRRLRRKIIAAAKRGLDVRLLTAGECDERMAKLAARYIYHRFLKAGVRIFELKSGLLHAKTLVVDGHLGMVGSFNLDRWSDRRNLEVVVAFRSNSLVDELSGYFASDLENSTEIILSRLERRGLVRRCIEWLAYQVMRH